MNNFLIFPEIQSAYDSSEPYLQKINYDTCDGFFFEPTTDIRFRISPKTKQIELYFENSVISTNGVIHLRDRCLNNKPIEKNWNEIPYDVFEQKKGLIPQLKLNLPLLHLYNIFVVIYGDNRKAIVDLKGVMMLIPEYYVSSKLEIFKSEHNQPFFSQNWKYCKEENDYYYNLMITRTIPEAPSNSKLYLLHQGELPPMGDEESSKLIMIGIDEKNNLKYHKVFIRPFLLLMARNANEILNVFKNVKYICSERPLQEVFFDVKIAECNFFQNEYNGNRNSHEIRYYFLYCKSLSAAICVHKLLASQKISYIHTLPNWTQEMMMLISYIQNPRKNMIQNYKVSDSVKYCTWFTVPTLDNPRYAIDHSINKFPFSKLKIFDIETVSPNPKRVPLGDKITDYIISISVYEYCYSTKQSKLFTAAFLPLSNSSDLPFIEKLVVEKIKKNNLENLLDGDPDNTEQTRKFLFFSSEVELITWFVSTICLDPVPFIMTGYSIFSYDLKVILRRIVKLGMNQYYDYLFLSRFGLTRIGPFMTPIDVYCIISKYYKNNFSDCKLSTVANHIKKENKNKRQRQKMDLQSVKLRFMWKSFLVRGITLETIPECLFSMVDWLMYNETDVVVVEDVIESYNLITLQCFISNNQNVPLPSVSWVPISVLLRYFISECIISNGTFPIVNQHRIVGTKLLSDCTLGFVNFVPAETLNPFPGEKCIQSSIDEENDEHEVSQEIIEVPTTSFAGGFNSCSGREFYEKVGVFDFNSFYPNTIEKFNVSYETCFIIPVSVLLMSKKSIILENYNVYRYSEHQALYSSSKLISPLLNNSQKHRALLQFDNCGAKLESLKEIEQLKGSEPLIFLDKRKRGYLSNLIKKLISQRKQCKINIAMLKEILKNIELTLTNNDNFLNMSEPKIQDVHNISDGLVDTTLQLYPVDSLKDYSLIWLENYKEHAKLELSRLICNEGNIKLCANSLYGLLGSDFNEYSDKILAAATTALCRHHIIAAAGFARCAGFEVVYIDTDSVFCVFNPPYSRAYRILLNKNLNETEFTEKELCQYLNDGLKDTGLEVDSKTMTNVFILKKKNIFWDGWRQIYY